MFLNLYISCIWKGCILSTIKRKTFTKEKLVNTLPLTNYDRDKYSHLSAFFEDWVDFLGVDTRYYIRMCFVHNPNK